MEGIFWSLLSPWKIQRAAKVLSPGIEDFYLWTPRNNLYRHLGKLFLYWGYGIQTVRLSVPWNSRGVRRNHTQISLIFTLENPVSRPNCTPGFLFLVMGPQKSHMQTPWKFFLYLLYGIQAVRFSTPWNSGGGEEKLYADFQRLLFPWKMDVTYPGKLYSSFTPWIISMYFHLCLGLFKMTSVVDNHERCLTTL